MGEHAAHCMLADLRAVDASQQQPQKAVGEPVGEPGRTEEARALSWPPPAELVPDTLTGFAFELFAHTTTFFGFKVRHTRTQLCPLTHLCPMRVCSSHEFQNTVGILYRVYTYIDRFYLLYYRQVDCNIRIFLSTVLV